MDEKALIKSVQELLHLIFDARSCMPNYMNRKIEIFKRCLVMQKTLVKVMHCKIVFVKSKKNRASLKYVKAFIDLDAVTLLVLQVSEKKFYWDPKEQSTK